MTEFLEVVKVTGPAIAIAVVLAFALWKENGQLQQKAFELYERLVAAQKENTLNLLRFCVSQPPERVPDLVAKYVDDLNHQMEDLQKQVDSLKAPPSA